MVLLVKTTPKDPLNFLPTQPTAASCLRITRRILGSLGEHRRRDHICAGWPLCVLVEVRRQHCCPKTLKCHPYSKFDHQRIFIQTGFSSHQGPS